MKVKSNGKKELEANLKTRISSVKAALKKIEKFTKDSENGTDFNWADLGSLAKVDEDLKELVSFIN